MRKSCENKSNGVFNSISRGPNPVHRREESYCNIYVGMFQNNGHYVAVSSIYVHISVVRSFAVMCILNFERQCLGFFFFFLDSLT